MAAHRFIETLLGLGCGDEARAQLFEAVRRHPGDEWARRALDRMADEPKPAALDAQCLEYRENKQVAG